jgi:hypothetical protein
VNKSKNRGTAYETAVVRYARENGFLLAERRALAGNLDKGDALLCPGVIVECKAHATVTDGLIREWLAETQREKANANASVGILVIKRPRKAIGDSYAVLAGAQGEPVIRFLSDVLILLRTGGYGEPL